MSRYVCIHGHFYQPPRENAWLEAVEIQDSARPYHDWNERITAECYAPNSASRILDEDGRIADVQNNYAHMSFNFGPTLLAWLQEHRPDVHDSIVEAERESVERFGGHTSAMAQVYNHLIMPLANARDKSTQVAWGLADFRKRFGREPEGMWLAETAVDLATLDVLAAHGVRFTVLAPRQAAAVRTNDNVNGEWKPVDENSIDTTQAYIQRLPSGREIVLFFYDGGISRDVAFRGLLDDGHIFADALMGAFRETDRGQLVHIATDGESYGHHHRHGDMALAWALRRIEDLPDVEVTNYGAFLEKHPPDHEVRIHERSSWSCVHGVGRWFEDCGCNSGGHSDWNQSWRGPLRESLDWLRDRVAPKWEEACDGLLTDPWAARDDYIQVILDRSDGSVARFLERHADRELTDDERVRVLELMEIQRHALLMYTSCGWFFDEISGLESMQVLQYAARVVQLSATVLEMEELAAQFLTRLEGIPSNIADIGNARVAYERYVAPASLELRQVAAHYAIASLFEDPERHERHGAAVYCYDVEDLEKRRRESGSQVLITGLVRVTFRLTGQSGDFAYAAFGLGDHNVACGVRTDPEPGFLDMVREGLEAQFQRADVAAALAKLHRTFLQDTFTLASLFRDEQRSVLTRVVGSMDAEARGAYNNIYRRGAPLLRFLSSLGNPLPPSVVFAAELVLNDELQDEFDEAAPDAERVTEIVREGRELNIDWETGGISFRIGQRLAELSSALEDARIGNPDLLRSAADFVAAADLLPFEVDFWEIQNAVTKLRKQRLHEAREAAHGGDGQAAEFSSRLENLADLLNLAPY